MTSVVGVRRSFAPLFAAIFLLTSGIAIGWPQPSAPPPKAPAPDALPVLVPERIDLKIPYTGLGQVLVKKFAVRVDTGKDFAKLSARVLNQRSARWLSLGGSAEPRSVISPSTQPFEISIDTGMLEGTLAAGVVEILGARTETLRLPVTVRVVSADARPAPSGSVPPPSAVSPSAPEKRPLPPAADQTKTPGNGTGAETSSGQRITPGRLSTLRLEFLLEPGKPAPGPKTIEVSLPVIPDRASPVIAYFVTRKVVEPQERVGTAQSPGSAAITQGNVGGGSPTSASDSGRSAPAPERERTSITAAQAPIDPPSGPDSGAALSWLAVSPEGKCTGLEKEKRSHEVTIRPEGRAPGTYLAAIEFRGIDLKPLLVLVKMEIR